MPSNFKTQGPDRLVSLISVSGARCAKHWRRNPDGSLACDGYGGETHWIPASYDAGSFVSFADALTRLANTNNAVVIRGALHDDAGVLPDDGFPRILRARNAPWRAEPRRWVALDIDGMECPMHGLNLRSSAHWAREQLPPIWRTAACWYQFTSSHAVDSSPLSLRLRLWFLTDLPVADFAWKGYWRGRSGLCLDVSLFSPVQPHYVCRPSFDGVQDPCGDDRIGTLTPVGGTERVPISAEMNDASRLLEPMGGTIAAEIPEGFANRQQIAVTLERLRTQATTGARHNHMLAAACELRGIGCPWDIAAPALEDIIRRQGRDVQSNEIDNAWRYADEQARGGTLRTDNPPVASQFPPLPPTPTAPPDPEEAAAAAASTDEMLAQVAEWSNNDHLNARLYRRTYHLNGSLIRAMQTDFEWTGTHWRGLESDEVLLNRVVQCTGMKHATCTATVRSLRGLVAAENLKAPCWISSRADASRVIQFQNGILDVDSFLLADSGAFRPSTPDLFNHVCCPYSYDPNATAPTFQRFMDDIYPGDEQAQRELLKMLGYLLTADNRYQKMFVIGGVTNSGKSTLARMIRKLIGEDAIASPSIASMGTNFGPSTLYGKSLALIAEANNGVDSRMIPPIATDIIKSITGGDAVQLDRKHKDPVSVTLPVRFVFCCNRLPHFLDPSGAMARRIQLFWLRQSFLGRADPTMNARLEAELPGIVNLALRGLRYLLIEDGGFKPLTSAAEQMRNYSRQMAPVAAFFEDCLDLSEGHSVSKQDLYTVYRGWCAESGRQPMNADRLVAELSELIPSVHEVRPRTDRGRLRQINGLKLTEEGVALLAGSAPFVP